MTVCALGAELFHVDG